MLCSQLSAWPHTHVAMVIITFLWLKTRAKVLFVENAGQVEEMVKLLRCEIQEDYLYRF